MPKASGKVLGKTSASEAATGIATSSCSRRPEKATVPAAARAASAYPGGRSSRKAESIGSGSSSAPSRPRPRVGELANRAQIAGREPAPDPAQDGLELAEADDQQPCARVRGVDQRPGGEQQVDALGDDQLADEDDPRAVGVRVPGRGRRRLRSRSRSHADVRRRPVGRQAVSLRLPARESGFECLLPPPPAELRVDASELAPSCGGQGRAASAAGSGRKGSCRLPVGRGGPWRWSAGSSTAWRRRVAMWPEPTRIPFADATASST